MISHRTSSSLRWIFLAAVLSVFGSVSHATNASSPFFPASANVVLLVGLAGDVETEKEYRDELQSWLDLLASIDGKPKKVFILSDTEPETTPADLPVQKLKGSREEFVGITKTLQGATNDLVVIAWGHGGMQGQTPVFHVRGPRITPGDVKGLAASVKGESQWILFFRSSGNFARELTAAGRRIISSENEMISNSDPVGASLLVKVLNSKPTLSFDQAGEKVGAAITAWYQNRNLVRIEEPTLWSGTDKPQELAIREATLSSVKASSQGTNETRTTNAIAANPTKLQTTTVIETNLPANWKEIRRIEPHKYPGADAVVLSVRETYTLGTRPALSTEHEEFIQILTEEGKREGDFDFAYAPPFEDMTFLACEVQKANGHLIRMDPETIRDSGESQIADFSSGRRKFFSLPDVGPGAVLHIHYRTKWQSFPMPQVSMKIPLSSDAPILRETLRINIPRDSAFHFSFAGIKAIDPQLKQTEYGTTYAWNFEDLPPHTREAMAPPGREPHLRISTFPDWSSFSDWYTRISKLSDEITPEITAKALELTRGAKTDEEKILAIYNYVTGLRYVAVEMGVNSFRPHAAANVLSNQFGDCKDKANLFNTLLRSLKAEKLDAHLVLVPRFTEADESTPGLAFNHAISRVTYGNKVIFLDTTDDVCRFGMLPPGDPGRKVLVIDGKSTSLTQLPSPLPQDHRLSLHAKLKCESLTSIDQPLTIQVETAGYPDYEFRSITRRVKEHSANSPVLTAKFRTANGTFSMDKQTYSSVSALSENFNWQAEGRIIGAVEVADDKRLILRAPFWLPTEWDVALHRRSSGLLLNFGYPLVIDEAVEFHLPPEMTKFNVPAIRENKEGPMKWKLSWQKVDQNIRAHLEVELSSGELTDAEAKEFQNQLRHCFAAINTGVEVASQ